MTHQLRSRELIDPNAIWTTPHESDLEGGRVFTKSSGTLVIANFTQNLSGLYSCNLRYIDPTIYTEREIVLRFMVYAYQESFLSFELSLRYHMGTCIDTFKRAFTEGLSKILNELVLDLSCDVSILHSECHIIELPQGGLQHQLYIKMKVSDLSPLSSVSCSGMNTCYRNERVIEAKNMINEFFFTQEEAIEQSTEELPMFYYIGGTLTVESVYHCFPGFGVDQEKHPRCPDCCVVCSPGTYSSSSGSSCEPCASSVAYGEQNCL
ncbi:zona pellucida-binding protein 1 [Protopterus annectens]|uniref:zona pellucida-binding protein 1 n=1 Tax=Protopterus annectens TaxID=7888 RepID=UPI001CFBA404|nr:zona pellucida-binding protein 1 [Protopterus annectens]XP_043920763.1 zona pellucida-binding protein 1 [Protopterus annectens]